MATKSKPPVSEVATSGEVVVPASAKWTALVANFASTITFGIEIVGAKLKQLVGTDDDDGVALLENVADTPDLDVKELFKGDNIALARLNKAIREMRTAPVVSHETVSMAENEGGEGNYSSLLPVVPDDTNLLASLGTFQGAQIDPIDVIAAMRVRLMTQLGLSDIESRIADSIEERADSNGEQCPPIWDEIEMARRRYAHADVLKALGKPGDLISPPRKKKLLGRIDDIFVRVHEYSVVLDAYREDYDRRTNNPANLVNAVTQALGRATSGRGRRLSEAPSPNNVVAATEALIQSFNSMFAGNGRAVARGMAADAIATKAILDRSDLPAALGATSRVQMIKDLKLGVESDLISAEKDIQQFIMGAMNLLKVPTNQLPDYIVDLSELGTVIPWNRLGVRAAASKSNGAPDPRPFPGENRKF